MLVLSRKKRESVRIADNIEIVVLAIKNGHVRLGFRCPDDVTVLRTEVHKRQQAEAIAAGISAVEHCNAG